MTWFNLNNTILGSANSKLYTNRATIQEGCACGTSHYAGLQISLNRNVSKSLTATVAYTYSHTLDKSNSAFATGTSGAGSRVFINSTEPNLYANYGNSDQDQRNVFVTSALYRLPFGRGQGFSGCANDHTSAGEQIIVALHRGGTSRIHVDLRNTNAAGCEAHGAWPQNTTAEAKGSNFDITLGTEAGIIVCHQSTAF